MTRFPNPSRIFQQDTNLVELQEEIWAFQGAHNPVVRKFMGLLGSQGPEFIPISFFKQFSLQTGGEWAPQATFGSSGTTGQQQSRHLVRDLEIYNRSLLEGFFHFYGKQPRKVLALLPNYLERQDSSLVYMVQHWIDAFGLPGSGFFLYEHAELDHALKQAEQNNESILLIGVSFALLDFCEAFPQKLPEGALVMETGGMKGRKKEMVRSELHAALRLGLGVTEVHSEYGMTELLSQAYSLGNERFHCPPWMKVVITDAYIPGKVLPTGRSGRINIVDLANVDSCAFIRTDDLGRLHTDGSFEVLGRLDHAELRGCNLMVADL